MPPVRLRENWFFKKHDFIYKQIEDGSEKLIVAKRLYCSNRGKDKGCGKTCRLQTSVSIYYLWYAIYAIWLFFSLHYISKKSIKDSYAKATKTKDSRNAYRWLGKLKANIPIIKSGIPPPEHHFQMGNDTSAFIIYVTVCFSRQDPPAQYQVDLQDHFMNKKH